MPDLVRSTKWISSKFVCMSKWSALVTEILNRPMIARTVILTCLLKHESTRLLEILEVPHPFGKHAKG